MQQNIDKLYSSAESVNEWKKNRDESKEIVEVPVGVASIYAHIPAFDANVCYHLFGLANFSTMIRVSL